MIKEQNTRDTEPWTTPVLTVLIFLHIILITTIFVIYAKRREAQISPKTVHLSQTATTPMSHTEFVVRRESLLKEKIKNKSEDIDACQELANLYKGERRYKEAVYVLESAIARDPNQAELHMQLGLLFYSQPDTVEKALEHFRKVLELNPDYSQKKVIEIWLKEGNKVKYRKSLTIEDLKGLLDKDPKNAELHYQISLLYLASPQTELEAIPHMEHVLELAPDHRGKMMIIGVLRRLKALAKSRESK